MELYKITEGNEPAESGLYKVSNADSPAVSQGPSQEEIRELIYQENYDTRRYIENTKLVAAKGKSTTAQATATGVTATLVFDTIVQDTGNILDIATGKFSIYLTGLYLFGANVNWDINAGGSRQIFIRVNGSGSADYYGRTTLTASAADNSPWQNTAMMGRLNKGDYIEVRAFQGSGGALNILASSAWIYRLPGSGDDFGQLG